MPRHMRPLAHAFIAISAALSLCFAVAPAHASDGSRPLAGTPLVSSVANSETRAEAAANPEAVQAAATLCGTGYVLENASALPTSTDRKGTLFTYGKEPYSGGINDQPTCAIFDNNTSTSKWMKLKLCSNYTAVACTTDEGNFSQYAGPVFQSKGGCGNVTALMKTSSASTTYLINAVRSATTCN
ncbi:hypothetical protein [Streptomyces sp. NPDC058620]|uniref:hypothetical protein n=1 Tax=Streptomyces sp. NPDC058620 TaxID=3346560 RepID=UPI00365A4404